MGKYFHRLVIILLLTFVGIGILSSGEVYAGGGSFDVPQVNDHFDQFEKGPTPKKEKSITQNTYEESGTWDWITKPVSGAWEWTKEKVSSAWEWTKETASSVWDWFVEIMSKITEVVVDALSAAWDWIVKYKEYVAFAGVLILGVVLCFVAPPLGAAILSGAALSFIISVALNGGKIDKTTFMDAAIGGVLGLIGGGIAGGLTRGLATGLGQKLITGVAGSRVLGPILRGGGKLISKLPGPIRQIFTKAGFISTVEGVGTSIADDLLRGRKINWKMAVLSGLFGAAMVGVVNFAKPAIDKVTASVKPVLAKIPIVKNLDDCFAYNQTPGYFALASNNFNLIKCFYSPDGTGGGSSTTKATEDSIDSLVTKSKQPRGEFFLAKDGKKIGGQYFVTKNGAKIKNGVIVEVNDIPKYRPATGKVDLDYVAKVRKDLGLLTPNEEAILVKNKILKNESTVAILEADGKQIWGRSSWGEDVENGYSELRKEWFNNRSPRPKKYEDRVKLAEQGVRFKATNTNTYSHAEGDVFWHLYKYRKENKILGGSATLYVDRPLCQYCDESKGVEQLVEEVGLDELKVVSPSGTQIIKPDPNFKRKSW